MNIPNYVFHIAQDKANLKTDTAPLGGVTRFPLLSASAPVFVPASSFPSPSSPLLPLLVPDGELSNQFSYPLPVVPPWWSELLQRPVPLTMPFDFLRSVVTKDAHDTLHPIAEWLLTNCPPNDYVNNTVDEFFIFTD